MQTTTPEEIRRKQDEGKTSGSKVHHCIYLQILGEKVLGTGITEQQIKLLNISDRKLISYLKEPLTEREEEALKGMENFWEEFKPVPLGNEMMVFSGKHRFAGTLDFIGHLYDKKTKKYNLWVCDWKISKTLDRSYDLQVASYWKAFEETYHKKLNRIRLGILQLGKNKCNYSFKEVKDKKKAWEMFLKTKEIYDDLNPNPRPPLIERREGFTLEKFTKKGRRLKLT
jgi:hypothetical protein